MSTPSASRSLPVDYHSLGVRKDWHYSDREKAVLFDSALQKIEELISSNTSGNAPTSIPEIVRHIFDDNQSNQDLEIIREALRPTSHLSLQSISATGQKLLALLAILQDERCLADDGTINLDYTKSVIRGWFHNPEQIQLDDSALRNIHQASSDNKIRMGKNRLGEIALNPTGKLNRILETNLKNARFGERNLTLDFSQRPQCVQPPDFHEIALGDMNGNSIMFLHELIQSGMADIRPGQDQAWDDLVNDIRQGNTDRFQERLEAIIEFKNTDKKLVLLGDLLADRTYNDWFTLSILDSLHKAGQNFSICFSNHDACFVEFYLANKDKSDSEQYVSGDTADFQHTVSPNNSLIALKNQLNNNPADRQKFRQMTENYLSHLIMLDSSLDQRNVYSHGILTHQMLRDMLTESGMTDEEIDHTALQERLNRVNNHFREQAFSSLGSFHELMKHPEGRDGSDKNPFHAAIWSTGPFSDNRIFMSNPNHPYLDPMPPMHIGRVVHGHTADIREKSAKKSTLSKLLASEARATASRDSSQEAMWTFTREAIQAGASSGLITASIARIIQKNIGTYQTAFSSTASVTSLAIRTIAERYPRSDVEFLRNYPESDTDELGRYIKAYKEKNKGDLKNIYLGLTNDPAAGAKIKSLLQNKMREAQLAAQKAMLGELETLNKALGSESDLSSLMPDDIAQAEILHTIGMKLGTYLASYNKTTSSNASRDPFTEILSSEQRSIWLTDNDSLAAENYVSLDSGVGATESESGGTVRIFTA